MMENQEKCVTLDPREEVRKLQEMVRKLEMQNEELRIGQKKNGFVLDSRKQQQPKLLPIEDDVNSSTESLYNYDDDSDLVDEQTWLYRSSKYNGDLLDLETWLEIELKRSVPSIDITGLRNNIARRLTEVKKSVEQRHVDTRTFTRPKKRLLPVFSTPYSQLEDYGEQMSAGCGVSHPSGSDEENTPVPNGSLLQYSQNVRERSLPRYSGPGKPSSLDGTFRLERSATPERQGGRRTPHEGSTGLPVPRSRLEKTFGYRAGSCSPLNRTFNLDGVSVRSGDGLEEDQMSSASDSSFSSSHRAALTAGEVRTLARMQEESLRYSSTPSWKSQPEGRQTVHQMSSDLPSPITRSTEDFQSDHSSVEGRSSRSSVVGDSLHSSPAGSPFGSSQALTTFPRTADGMIGSNEALDRPQQARNVPNKQRVEGQAGRGLVRPMLAGARALSAPGAGNLKPQCLVRPSVQAGGGGAAQPVSTGIPRPLGVRAPGSRIPAPRSRAALSKAQDWMDGCY